MTRVNGRQSRATMDEQKAPGPATSAADSCTILTNQGAASEVDIEKFEAAYPNLSREKLDGRLAAADRAYQEKAERDQEAAAKETEAAVEKLKATLGPRYADCSIANFAIYDPKQKPVVDALDGFLDDIGGGQPVTLIGPCGTGKDHLLATLAIAACRAGIPVLWLRGWQVAAFVAKLESEKFIQHELPDGVICVSDPIERADLMPSERPSFATLVDMCYTFQRPIWVSMNAKDADDAVRLYGARVWDRLRHEGLVVECFWESYRARK